MCKHVVSLGAPTNGWRAGGGVQPFLGMWPSMCQSWVAIQMYSLESHGTENRGSFLQQYYPFLVDDGMAKHNTLLPLTGRRLALGRHQHHNDVLLLLFFFFFVFARAPGTSAPQWRWRGCCCPSSFLYLHVTRPTTTTTRYDPEE